MTEKIENNKSRGNEFKCPCVKCSVRTSHKVLQSVDVTGCENWGDGYTFDYNHHYQIVQCLGCQEISFRDASSNSEDYVYYDNDVVYPIREKLYPSRIENRKGLGDDMNHLPRPVLDIYEETLQSMMNQSPILAGIGLRALVETICKEKNAKGGNLEKKIDDLVAQKILTPRGRDLLHKIRTLGNDAAHEVKPHTEKQLGVAMDVIENLMRDVYILPKQMRTVFK